MRIVALSDTHGMHELVQVPGGDLLIFAGDCSSQGREPEIQAFLQWFAAQPHPHKVMIAGNHDFLFEKNPDKALAMIPPGIHYLNDSGLTIEGLKIWGSPISPRFFNWAFNRERGEAIARHWRLIPDETDILITHGPPAGILDRTVRGHETGCKDLLQHIKRVRPELHIFGHIHEEYGIIRKDGTCFVNASNADVRYRIRNAPIVIEGYL
jgi:predicted phosphohydrolase